MSKRGSWAFVASILLFGLVGCASTAPAPVAEPAGGGGCFDASKLKTVTLTINDDASVTPDCVIVQKGSTDVFWDAGENVMEILNIKFVPADACDKPPQNPTPVSAKQWELEHLKHAAKGVFDYNVLVRLEDGREVGKDPVIIIKP